MSEATATFISTSAKRSRAAELLCSKHKGRFASCDAAGLVVEISGHRRELAYDRLVSVVPFKGRFWGTVTVAVANGPPLIVSGLSKAAAVKLAHALNHNLSVHARELAERLSKQLDAVDIAIADLTSGTRFVAAHMVRLLEPQITALAPLIHRKLIPGALPAAIEAKIKRVAEFSREHEAIRERHNAQFIIAEAGRLKHYFETVETNPLTQAQIKSVIVDEDRNLVVAAAGSGKTSVIVAKVGYLLRKGLRRPDDILMMAFGRHARSEMKERLAKRIGASVAVETFHALGLSIVKQVEGRPPPLSPIADDEVQLQSFIRKAVEELLTTNRRFARLFIEWFQSHFVPYRSHWEFKSWGEYWQYVRDYDIRTLKGERVRSYEECEIANWFYLNGIKYEYEAQYEHDVASPERRQYKPDFFLPELGVYVEHFALDSVGRTPPFIDREQYLAGVKWKRETHGRYGTTLVETYSYEKREGVLLSDLKRKLEERLGRAVETTSMSTGDALKWLEERGRIDSFSRLTAAFLRHFKGSQIDLSELRHRVSLSPDKSRAAAYVEVFADLYSAYQAKLKERNEIDFEDMIGKAAEYVESGRFVSPYAYILVDEFQDISVGRAKLLKALINQRPDNQLFAVGDDWQSIFRFAGSDISLMREFADHFGVTARTDLSDTFRCVDRIADVASKFILRNDAQITKSVNAVRKAVEPRVFVIPGAGQPHASGLREALGKIARHAEGRPAGVLLIGRYNFLKPTDLADLQIAFPTLKLRFKSAHGSKGLEDDYVIVLGLQAGRMGFPTGIADDLLLNLVLAAPEPFPNAEERRLFYVVLTRAKQAVFLLADSQAPSPFISEFEREGYDVASFSRDVRAAVPCPECKEGHFPLTKAWGCIC